MAYCLLTRTLIYFPQIYDLITIHQIRLLVIQESKKNQADNSTHVNYRA